MDGQDQAQKPSTFGSAEFDPLADARNRLIARRKRIDEEIVLLDVALAEKAQNAAIREIVQRELSEPLNAAIRRAIAIEHDRKP